MTKYPTLLISNDDGPPSTKSPFLIPFLDCLTKLGWNYKVVIPNCQKSWISKGFHIEEEVLISYYNPKTGDISSKQSEGDWILLNATPAACVNIALHHLFVNEIDLVVTGPNLGRNTGNASALSSGTIGGALEGVVCGVRSIALSFGYFGYETIKEENRVLQACNASAHLIHQLWNHWNTIPEPPQLFNINVPLIAVPFEGYEWCQFYNGGYSSLYTKTDDGFLWKPKLITENPGIGTDFWAITQNKISITPLQAGYSVEKDLNRYEALPLSKH
ncbi:survival protein sure-like phosphatase/nucleotidase [Globomyces pollinis-pini]|nr:survival protein sure-like phosphatase/nucleotidase [Globomyces pollinis-pini]